MITGDNNTRIIKIDGKVLNPAASQNIYNHSPDGFSWGYNGSGCAQLALAILLHFASKEFAIEHYQKFKSEIVAKEQLFMDLKISNNVVHDFIKANK